jgi:hypothetical protein
MIVNTRAYEAPWRIYRLSASASDQALCRGQEMREVREVRMWI